MSGDKTTLIEELEPLQAQIEQTRGKLRLLEGELRTVEAEIALFAADKQRFDTLRDVCKALDAPGELSAGQLFWQELPEGTDVAGHLSRLRERIARFEEEIRGTQEKHESLKVQIHKCHQELNFLHEEVRQAHAREDRRNEEFLVEREVSPVPYRPMVMPWNNRDEGEKRYHQALSVAFVLSIVICSLIPLWKLPAPDRSAVIEIPERLAMLVKKEQAKPEPLPKASKEAKKLAKDQKKAPEPAKEERLKATSNKSTTPTATATATAETESARNKAESTGVLAFKESFRDLIDETPVARLGVESHLSNQSGAAGQAQASRSLVAMQAGGSSGGIGNAAVSRNIGNGTGNGSGNGTGSGYGNGHGNGSGNGSGSGNGNRLGGVGVARVESTVAGLAEASRPLSSKVGPARTDEEIQIVFDRYKATLYRIYNAELRKIPTLRGKMIMRITIEPGGEVSACTVQSTDLASPELVEQIVERVKKFNFGPKEKVPTTTILYPIDFLPAG